MSVTMREMLEAGVHFGHQTRFWNPKMAPFIFGHRNKIHIINLEKTLPMYLDALKYVRQLAANRGTIMFVGTKRQSREILAEEAARAGMPFVDSRWLGGMLTNWKTISGSIQRLRKVDETLEGGAVGLTKKERLMLTREKDKLEKALGGIKDMGGVPDLLFVIDTNKEQLAIKEAQRLGIPVAAIVDTNCNPDGISYIVPANDDAGRAIALYCDLIARAAIEGIGRGQGALGIDVGASEEPTAEELPANDDVVASVASDAIAPADVAALAESTEHFEQLVAPRGAPDDLTKLTGVGPQLVQKLNDAGVWHYWQIAAMQPEDVAKLDADLKLNGRIDRDGWIAQSRGFVEAAAA